MTRLPLLLLVVVSAAVAVGIGRAPTLEASHRHDSYLRKAPWGAAVTHAVTQGYCGDPGGGHNCPPDGTGEYHRYALDFDMYRENLYSTTDATVASLKYETECLPRYIGYAVVASWYDRSLGVTRYVTYGHMESFSSLATIGRALAQGDLLGVSGNTGYTDPCYAYHLHYNEQNGCYGCASLLPEPMDGQSNLHTGGSYGSTNVWIGFCFGDPGCGDIHREYLALGGALVSNPKVGPVYNRGYGLSPYRLGGSWLEDFDDGTAFPQDHAHIIQGLSVGRAYVVRDFAWTIYVNDTGGPAGWLGAPKEEEKTYHQLYKWQYQEFEGGHICWTLDEYGNFVKAAWPPTHTGCI